MRPFEAVKTRDRDFTLENGDIISIQMMSESDCRRNYVNDGEKKPLFYIIRIVILFLQRLNRQEI